MTVTRMLSRKGRWWGICDNDDGKEEVVEVDNNNKTIVALGGGGRRKGGFEEPSRIEVGPGNKIQDGSGTDPGQIRDGSGTGRLPGSVPASILFLASSGTDDM